MKHCHFSWVPPQNSANTQQFLRDCTTRRYALYLCSFPYSTTCISVIISLVDNWCCQYLVGVLQGGFNYAESVQLINKTCCLNNLSASWEPGRHLMVILISQADSNLALIATLSVQSAAVDCYFQFLTSECSLVNARRLHRSIVSHFLSWWFFCQYNAT